MNRRSAWFIAAFILLLLGGALGLYNGPGEVAGAQNGWQRMAALIEAGYGLFGLAGAGALWIGHRWTRPLLLGWAVLITLTGGLAPVVWGETSIGIGIGSGIASGLVALIVVWLAQNALRNSGR